MRRKLAAGNWKMNGIDDSLDEIFELSARIGAPEGTDVLICPPATLLTRACAAAEGTHIAIGAQDCHAETSGAFTGDISAQMIADAGGSCVILGHSERRTGHQETDAMVRAKAEAAHASGLTAIICIGESEAERDTGQTLGVLAAQLDGSCPDGAMPGNTVIAYEPIWAIGTGKTPGIEQIAEVHDALRARLNERFGASGDGFRLLYGGSVKAANAAEIFAVRNVDGALVGGASLQAEDFAPIVEALAAS